MATGQPSCEWSPHFCWLIPKSNCFVEDEFFLMPSEVLKWMAFSRDNDHVVV